MFEKLDELNLKEIIGYSIDSEKEAIKFYNDILNSVSTNELVKQVIQNIIRDEELHRDTLLKLHEVLFGDKDYVVPEGLPPFESSARFDDIQTLVSALDSAMQNELNAEKVYKHCAKKYSQHSLVFNQHALMEKGHFETLKLQRDLYKEEIDRNPGIKEKPLTEIMDHIVVHDKKGGGLHSNR